MRASNTSSLVWGTSPGFLPALVRRYWTPRLMAASTFASSILGGAGFFCCWAQSDGASKRTPATAHFRFIFGSPPSLDGEIPMVVQKEEVFDVVKVHLPL